MTLFLLTTTNHTTNFSETFIPLSSYLSGLALAGFSPLLPYLPYIELPEHIRLVPPRTRSADNCCESAAFLPAIALPPLRRSISPHRGVNTPGSQPRKRPQNQTSPSAPPSINLHDWQPYDRSLALHIFCRRGMYAVSTAFLAALYLLYSSCFEATAMFADICSL